MQEVWRVIGEIRAAGIATLIVDRNYRKVAKCSDPLVVLQKGRVVLSGASRPLAAGDALTALLGVWR